MYTVPFRPIRSKKKLTTKGPGAAPSENRDPTNVFSPLVKFSWGMIGEAHAITAPFDKWSKLAEKINKYTFFYDYQCYGCN